MNLPTLEQLQHVTSLLWKEDFTQLDDARKLQVVEIAQRGIQAKVLDDLALEFGIQFAETVASWNVGAIHKQLEEIDASLGPIMEWFSKSRLYEP